MKVPEVKEKISYMSIMYPCRKNSVCVSSHFGAKDLKSKQTPDHSFCKSDIFIVSEPVPYIAVIAAGVGVLLVLIGVVVVTVVVIKKRRRSVFLKQCFSNIQRERFFESNSVS